MQISENDLADARQSWGDGLIKISQIFESSGIDEAKSFASSLTDNLYGFDFGPILFKPTLSGGPKTFRQDKEGTLSYFTFWINFLVNAASITNPRAQKLSHPKSLLTILSRQT